MRQLFFSFFFGFFKFFQKTLSDRDLSDAEVALERTTERAERRLDSALAELEAYSPFGVLKRGYAVVTDAGGHIVSSLRDAVPGETVSVRISDGAFTARVEGTGELIK